MEEKKMSREDKSGMLQRSYYLSKQTVAKVEVLSRRTGLDRRDIITEAIDLYVEKYIDEQIKKQAKNTGCQDAPEQTDDTVRKFPATKPELEQETPKDKR